MLLLINTPLPSIKDKIYLVFSPNRKKIMALLESIHIKRFTLTSNLELSQCTIVLTLFFTFIDKTSKTSSTTWLNLVSLNHAGPMNGRPLPSIFPKRMFKFDKSPIIQKHYTLPIITDMLDCISIFKFFTILCNITHMSSTNPARSCALFSHYFAKKVQTSPYGTWMHPWLCPASHGESVYLDDIGAFLFTWKHLILLLDKILHWLEANGFTVNLLKCKWATRKLIGLDNDSHPWVWSHGIKKSMVSYNCKKLKTFCNVWFPWCCQPLLTNVATIHTHSCTPFQQVGKENILLDTQNGSCFQTHESPYGIRLFPCSY